ncbi:hypothetical protein Tco_0128151 [Tanacetum coccineum]
MLNVLSGLEILVFACNEFLKQQHGSIEKIEDNLLSQAPLIQPYSKSFRASDFYAVYMEQLPPDAEEIDLQFSLEDLETIGKGSDGVVQLVRQKWIGTFFASKVLLQIT